MGGGGGTSGCVVRFCKGGRWTEAAFKSCKQLETCKLNLNLSCMISCVFFLTRGPGVKGAKWEFKDQMDAR